MRPAIGKSRLTVALLERLAAEPHTRLRYFCSPQHTDSALYPIIGQMERAAGLAHDDTPQARLDKLDAVLAQTLGRLEVDHQLKFGGLLEHSYGPRSRLALFCRSNSVAACRL
jgi:predicted ATPase